MCLAWVWLNVYLAVRHFTVCLNLDSFRLRANLDMFTCLLLNVVTLTSRPNVVNCAARLYVDIFASRPNARKFTCRLNVDKFSFRLYVVK